MAPKPQCETAPAKKTWREYGEQQDRIEAALEELRYSIHGNGEPGLKGRVQRIETVQQLIAWVGGAVFVAVLAVWFAA